jgi:hypothetical protein
VVPRAVQAFIGYWREALEGGFPVAPRTRASRAR